MSRADLEVLAREIERGAVRVELPAPPEDSHARGGWFHIRRHRSGRYVSWRWVERDASGARRVREQYLGTLARMRALRDAGRPPPALPGGAPALDLRFLHDD